VERRETIERVAEEEREKRVRWFERMRGWPGGGGEVGEKAIEREMEILRDVSALVDESKVRARLVKNRLQTYSKAWVQTDHASGYVKFEDSIELADAAAHVRKSPLLDDVMTNMSGEGLLEFNHGVYTWCNDCTSIGESTKQKTLELTQHKKT
jgi:hypothetical protein